VAEGLPAPVLVDELAEVSEAAFLDAADGSPPSVGAEPVGDDVDDDDEDVTPPPVSACASPNPVCEMAEPIPSATASAPMRPMYFAGFMCTPRVVPRTSVPSYLPLADHSCPIERLPSKSNSIYLAVIIQANGVRDDDRIAR
jgi:hypothetical protein